jgi:DNA modification methylase
MNWAVHLGDAIEILRQMPACSVECCVTSPPYFGLRDYQDDRQVGAETSPDRYVARLVAILAEVKRVLMDTGVLWLNLGDSYINKSLAGIPWRVALTLRDGGWHLRSDVIWAKPNTMPESVTDRPTRAHEHVFLLVKSRTYVYNADAITDPAIGCGDFGLLRTRTGVGEKDGVAWHAPSIAKRQALGIDSRNAGSLTRNARSVWTINSEPSLNAHFALMPKALARRCVLSGCPIGGTVLDPFAGLCTTGVVALEEGRSFVGIELNPAHHTQARARLSQCMPLFSRESTAGDWRQGDLLQDPEAEYART